MNRKELIRGLIRYIKLRFDDIKGNVALNCKQMLMILVSLSFKIRVVEKVHFMFVCLYRLILSS